VLVGDTVNDASPAVLSAIRTLPTVDPTFLVTPVVTPSPTATPEPTATPMPTPTSTPDLSGPATPAKGSTMRALALSGGFALALVLLAITLRWALRRR